MVVEKPAWCGFLHFWNVEKTFTRRHDLYHQIGFSVIPLFFSHPIDKKELNTPSQPHRSSSPVETSYPLSTRHPADLKSGVLRQRSPSPSRSYGLKNRTRETFHCPYRLPGEVTEKALEYPVPGFSGQLRVGHRSDQRFVRFRGGCSR